MTPILVLAFLFSVGALFGWGIEVLYRKFFSGTNKTHKWVNPGFLTGPYLPLYGFGLMGLYGLACLERVIDIKNPVLEKLILFGIMAICMTIIEYIAGVICIKVFHVKLWDYSNLWGNINGIICPLFSAFWAVLGAIYYFLVHPHIQNSLIWLASNLAFSFFIGMFYGVFAIDLVKTTKLMIKLKTFAEENQIIFRIEDLKERIHQRNIGRAIKNQFLFNHWQDEPLRDVLRDYLKSKQTPENIMDRANDLMERYGDEEKK